MRNNRPAIQRGIVACPWRLKPHVANVPLFITTNVNDAPTSTSAIAYGCRVAVAVAATEVGVAVAGGVVADENVVEYVPTALIIPLPETVIFDFEKLVDPTLALAASTEITQLVYSLMVIFDAVNTPPLTDTVASVQPFDSLPTINPGLGNVNTNPSPVLAVLNELVSVISTRPVLVLEVLDQ